MEKTKMGNQRLLNPLPVIIVGTYLDNKPNFITVSWTGITSEDPSTIMVVIRNTRYSLKGIRENKTFSINVPSADILKETDYCGLASGSETDKAKDCNFQVFYGKSDTAPLIEECPINMECEVYRIIPLGDHTLIFGKIIESYISENCFTNHIPDIRKINPMCICTVADISSGYYTVGEFLGTWGIGESVKKYNTEKKS
jgi:flavin reductase (DIM6/NTAB) family NADH-FMN oxidoreductase RutF